MRDYSKPPFLLEELAAVYIGLCNAINENCSNDLKVMSYTPTLRNAINNLSNKYNSPIKASGFLDSIGTALQSLIDTMMQKGIINKPLLEENVHPILHKLPSSFLIDYFTGEKKGDW